MVHICCHKNIETTTHVFINSHGTGDERLHAMLFCTFNQPPSPDTSMPSWISVKLVSLPLSLHFKCLTQLLARSAACNLVWGRKILTLFQRERL